MGWLAAAFQGQNLLAEIASLHVEVEIACHTSLIHNHLDLGAISNLHYKL